ncbi:DUF1963 domain-containing protein [Streptomyces chattanoogensis]|uniref:DUF1963 domain-containing protein n=1 Tax=Streptomyces chattanoogensis TaxID=66876 RepID=UPI0036C32EFA
MAHGDYGDTDIGWDYGAEAAKVRQLCIAHLGEHLGTQMAALARPGFGLRPVKDGTVPAGHTRWGGPALLDPGTPWPECEGAPLSLFAVLDVEALGPWPVDERPPAGVGLLNVFYLEEDPHSGERHLPLEDPRRCRIVPARHTQAVEVAAPAPAPASDPVALYAVPVVTLPSPFSVDYDPVLDTLDYTGETGTEDWATYYASMPGWLIADRFGEAWRTYCEQEQGLYAYDDVRFSPDQAFGWPHLEGGTHDLKALSADEPYRHLVTIGHHDLCGDGSYLHFVLPAKALREGDWSQTVALVECF